MNEQETIEKAWERLVDDAKADKKRWKAGHKILLDVMEQAVALHNKQKASNAAKARWDSISPEERSKIMTKVSHAKHVDK